MKLIAIDYGTKTCGIAIANLAIGAESILPPISTDSLIPHIKNLIQAHNPDILIFGLPLTKAGKEGQRAKKVISLVKYLKTIYTSKPLIETFDERYSTIEAAQMLEELPRKNSEKLKDSVSALIILREYQNSLK
ncbi:MAG: Holliday junction resolvase RuvX [Aquificaceae bacterium]|nr:Holliday junction resolvase RuvX [Aquificaceae bacterium]